MPTSSHTMDRLVDSHTCLHIQGILSSDPSPGTSVYHNDAFNLKSHFQHIKPTSPRPTTSNAYIPQELDTATLAFIRHDAVRKPLQPPYDGPYPIIKRTNIWMQQDTALDSTNPTSEPSQPQPSTTSPTPLSPLSPPIYHYTLW